MKFAKILLTAFLIMGTAFYLCACGDQSTETSETSQVQTVAPGTGITVHPARATWSTGFFLEALYSQALKDLGYTVEKPDDLANPIFYQAVMQGDVDFWANGWFPLHDEQLPQGFEKKASLCGTVAAGGALQGYLISKSDAEKFNITSVADFARPEVRKHFDTDGNGKAEMISCPPGWGCEKANTAMLKKTGLDQYIEQIKANYSASMADGIARYNAGGPIFFYTWTPNWTVYKLALGKDIVWINVPAEGYENTKGSNVEGATTDPIYMGFVPNDIKIVANNEFLAKNPAAAKLFQVMSVPLADIASQNNKMFEGEDKAKDIKRHVQEWIAAHKEQYDGWLKQAAAAAQ